MAPISYLQHARDVLGDVGNKLKGAGEKVADTGADVVDKGEDATDTLNGAKDVMDTYNKFKDQATTYYQWYLDHKQLIIFLLCCIALIILLCLAQCVIQYLVWLYKCCACPVKCGIFCYKHRNKCGPCCRPLLRGCGNCLAGSQKCILGDKGVKQADARTNDADPGCDTAFLTRCGNPPNKNASPEELEEQRLGVWINRHLPCPVIPGTWGRPMTMDETRRKIEGQLDKFLNGYKNEDKDEKGPAKMLMKAGARRAVNILSTIYLQHMPAGQAKDILENKLNAAKKTLKMNKEKYLKEERRAKHQ